MSTSLQPREGFDWSRVRWGGPMDPVSHVCSYCSAAVGEAPLRLFSKQGDAAVFCVDCQRTWWGVDFAEDDADPYDYPNEDDQQEGA